MAQAAAELQSRIYNIVENDWVMLTKRYEGHGDYPTKSTAFLFAHYFGWIEARRQSVLDLQRQGWPRREGPGPDRRHPRRSCAVARTAQGFSFFSAEQRAIGELMFFWEVVPDSGLRIPHVLGYAAFSTRTRTIRRSASGSARSTPEWPASPRATTHRLIDIQGALVHLILELDPKQRYTTGYDLKPIGAEVGWTPDGASAVLTEEPAEEQATQ